MEHLIKIGIYILVAVLKALPIMLLWNACIPDIFGITEITFLQAMWLGMLSELFFSHSSSGYKLS